MSNTDTSIVFDNNIDTSIAFAIGRITKAQTELATYTTILGQLYRTKEADRNIKRGIDPLLDDPIESFESIEELQAFEANEELEEPRAPVPQEHLQYKQHLLARRQADQKEAYTKERHANATRIQYLPTRLDELQALETKVREEQAEEDKNQPLNGSRVNRSVLFKQDTKRSSGQSNESPTQMCGSHLPIKRQSKIEKKGPSSRASYQIGKRSTLLANSPPSTSKKAHELSN